METSYENFEKILWLSKRFWELFYSFVRLLSRLGRPDDYEYGSLLWMSTYSIDGLTLIEDHTKELCRSFVQEIK